MILPLCESTEPGRAGSGIRFDVDQAANRRRTVNEVVDQSGDHHIIKLKDPLFLPPVAS